ncbi:hypothetical protein [Tropicimonas sp. IMCC6043]|uniref:hypothetical protein n=1 Tax=Tropicimonas sp. IMCC6043 TaxID=2510645 RepID=UPI0013EB4EAF|nr:hypothetical protein [Tropicimonas sp. IMCC6043]
MSIRSRIDRLEEQRGTNLVVVIADRVGEDGELIVNKPIPEARKVVILEPDTKQL